MRASLALISCFLLIMNYIHGPAKPELVVVCSCTADFKVITTCNDSFHHEDTTTMHDTSQLAK